MRMEVYDKLIYIAQGVATCMKLSAVFYLYRCVYNGDACSSDDFEMTLTNFGVCYTFHNINDTQLRSYVPGMFNDHHQIQLQYNERAGWCVLNG